MNTQIYIGDTLAHPETDSEVVLHNDSNLKNFLNGLVSVDNMPQFMQDFLMSADYKDANRALQSNPETYFDECFNSWTGVGSPVVANNVLNLNGSQYIYSNGTFSLTDTFCIQICITTGSDVSTSQCFADFYVSTNKRIIFDIASDTIRINIATNGTGHCSTAASVSANSVYFIELDRDFNSNYWRFFCNGRLVGSLDTGYSSTANINHKVYLGSTYVPSRQMSGKINEFRLSNCVRHTSNHSTGKDEYFSLDSFTLSLLHFDN